MKAEKGDWVRIHSILLRPEQRASQVPDDTKKVPLEMWGKGFLQNESATAGDTVEIETILGRKLSGELIEVNPQFAHGWGECIPEILRIGLQLKSILAEEGAEDE